MEGRCSDLFLKHQTHSCDEKPTGSKSSETCKHKIWSEKEALQTIIESNVLVFMWINFVSKYKTLDRPLEKKAKA